MTEWVKLGFEILAAALGTSVAAVCFAWKARGWVDDQFKANRQVMYQQGKEFQTIFKEHEREDERRHLENLARFTDIAVVMAEHGIRLHKPATKNGP